MSARAGYGARVDRAEARLAAVRRRREQEARAAEQGAHAPAWVGPVPFCPHLPHPRQAEFLGLTCREALYGGAAGGGKSDALLMAALQYVDTPGYRAIILRKSFPQLRLPGGLLERAAEWLRGTAAVWRERDHEWTFPSGATLTFGHLDTERDLGRYQGPAFHLVAFDELTQFPERFYRHLFSRTRRLAGSEIPIRVRGATNPGGVGHEWVMSRFEPHVPVEERQTGDRVFVPALLEDNPSLDAEDYERSLEELDPVSRAQLRWGNWLVRPSVGFFRREWFKIEPMAPGGLTWVRFWDCAAKAKQRSDYWAGARCARDERGALWIGHVVRDKWEYADGREAILSTALGEPEIAVGIEDTSSGTAVISDLRRDRRAAGLTIWPATVVTDKAVRAGPWASRALGGMVHLVAGSWNAAFLDEVSAFPTAGVADDQVDAVSGAWEMLVKRRKELRFY